MEPFVSRFIGESRMPGHEIRKRLDLTRGFHDALWMTNDFKAARRGKESEAITRSLQKLLESEINRRSMVPE
jgi:hypothetical protein